MGLHPFRLTLYDEEQLRFLQQRLNESTNVVAHIDGTAGIIRRTEQINRQLFLCSLVITGREGEHKYVSISDAIMERTRTEDIGDWLLRLICAYARVCGAP